VLDEVGEGVVEVAGWLLEDAEGDFNAGGAKFGDSLATDLRVRVFGGDYGSGDAGGDEGVGAGAGSSVVGAGLEGDVGGGSGDVVAAFAGLLEGGDLGVVALVVEVSAFADDLVFFDEDAAYLRIGRGEGDGFMGEGERPLHEGFVFFVVERSCHALNRIACQACIDRSWECRAVSLQACYQKCTNRGNDTKQILRFLPGERRTPGWFCRWNREIAWINWLAFKSYLGWMTRLHNANSIEQFNKMMTNRSFRR